jgi:hypothetical protein
MSTNGTKSGTEENAPVPEPIENRESTEHDGLRDNKSDPEPWRPGETQHVDTKRPEPDKA